MSAGRRIAAQCKRATIVPDRVLAMSRDPLGRRLQALAPDRVPGLAVVVVGPEGARDVGAAGFADIAAGTEATPQMVCPWFSMT